MWPECRGCGTLSPPPPMPKNRGATVILEGDDHRRSMAKNRGGDKDFIK